MSSLNVELIEFAKWFYAKIQNRGHMHRKLGYQYFHQLRHNWADSVLGWGLLRNIS